MLRSCCAADHEFLLSVYASSRAEEISQIVDWNDQQRDEFLRFQFEAQHKHYQEHYPNACYDVILIHGVPCGRLYVDAMEKEIRLMDIALLPQYHGRGIGRALILDTMKLAQSQGKIVSLHVEENNPAKKLYESLGFLEAGEVSFYKLMHWPAEERPEELQVNTAS